mgnify:CR=1 FL=1
MPVPANLVHQLTTGTGTGNLPLTAVPGKQTFGAAFPAGTANECDYFVSHRTAAEWEYGTAHVTAGALVRDTVIGSSNANAAVNFSAGDKDVTNDIPAAKQVTTDTVQTLSNKTFLTPALGTPASGTLTNCTSYPSATTTTAGIVETSTKTENETGSSSTVYPSVLGVAQHVSAAKAWFNLDSSGVIADRRNFNVASYTDTGVGDYLATLTNAMSDINYLTIADGDNFHNNSEQSSASAGRFTKYSSAHTAADGDYMLGAFYGPLA